MQLVNHAVEGLADFLFANTAGSILYDEISRFSNYTINFCQQNTHSHSIPLVYNHAHRQAGLQWLPIRLHMLTWPRRLPDADLPLLSKMPCMAGWSTMHNNKAY